MTADFGDLECESSEKSVAVREADELQPYNKSNFPLSILKSTALFDKM